MVDVDALLAAVTSRYAAEHLPAWPDPWGGASPDDAAYSRCTEPERYEILFRRTAAWLTELARVPELTVEPMGEVGALSQGELPVARGWRVSSDRPGTLPLLVLERDEPMPVVTFALAEPEVVLERQPDCGCDACDGGSETMLRAVDELFVEVLTSPVVVVRGEDGRWEARWSRMTAGAGGSPGPPRPAMELVAACRRIAAGEEVDLPRGARVWVSQPWLGPAPGEGVASPT